ncbi:MAG: hypothetical protein PPHEINF_3420 [uncultured Paraburkholderia sp.]|nr:MAG: hypothetical protein PPHEINF_3420 [uncultured Paraburkholderia sp.]CAH2794677.1 MAG: hypothetical protein PPHEESC_3651 [uncultured Paraburkholderia sp.]
MRVCIRENRASPAFIPVQAAHKKTFLRRGIKRLATRFARLSQRIDRTIKKPPQRPRARV